MLACKVTCKFGAVFIGPPKSVWVQIMKVAISSIHHGITCRLLRLDCTFPYIHEPLMLCKWYTVPNDLIEGYLLKFAYTQL